MLIDDADEHRLGLAAVAAGGGEDSDAVAQLANQHFGDLLRMGGDHFDLQRLFAALNDLVAHEGGDIAVQDAEDDGLHVEIIYEVGNQRHDGVEVEDYAHQRIFRALFMHIGREKVGAAGAAAAAHRRAVDQAVDRAGSDGGENRAAAVVRVVDKPAYVDDVVLQKQQKAGEREGKDEGFHGEGAVDIEEREDRQRDVDDQRHVADAEMEQVLNHRGDTVDAGRREGVLQNENLVLLQVLKAELLPYYNQLMMYHINDFVKQHLLLGENY